MPGFVSNNYLKECVMRLCNQKEKSIQLESVSFQGSACALIQANLINKNFDDTQIFKTESSEVELFKFVAKIGSKLFVLNLYKKSFIEVCKNDFDRRDLPCFKYKDWTVKFIGEKTRARDVVIKLKHKIFTPEDLLDTCSQYKNQFTDFLSGMSTIFDLLAGLGRVSKDCRNKYDIMREQLVNPLIESSVYQNMKAYGTGLVKVMISIYRVVFEKLNALNFSSLILDIYSLVRKSDFFQSESLESIVVAGVSTLLPESIIFIIKKMTVLTNKKLFDDNGFIFEFFTLLTKLITCVISFFPKKVQDFMNSVLDLFGLVEFLFIYKAQKLLSKYTQDRHIILRDSFRNEVKELNKEVQGLNLKRFFSKNKPLSEVAVEFERIHKAVISYEQTSRQEPCCFVFQGPPGCRKSVTVNKVIATLGLTHYSHIVKCAEDSKDWYDSYNNEDIFYMDDVGQMGKSQWRNLINWVSAVKLPLDCAEASLKDTCS